MLTRSLVQRTQQRTAEMLAQLGFILTPQERENIEVDVFVDPRIKRIQQIIED